MSRVTFWLHLILPQFPSLSISNWINPTKSPTLLSSLQQKRASSETEATTYYIDYYALQLQHNTTQERKRVEWRHWEQRDFLKQQQRVQ
jgi:hypothetical protein